MRRSIIVALLLSSWAWGQTAPKTMADWIAKANAKHEKCNTSGLDGVGGGTNGYDSWTFECVNGVIVYKDTTKESQEAQAKQNAHDSNLANALVSRCLTASEFKEVTQRGFDIYVRPMQPYYEEDLRQRFNAALLTQQILRQQCPEVIAKADIHKLEPIDVPAITKPDLFCVDPKKPLKGHVEPDSVPYPEYDETSCQRSVSGYEAWSNGNRITCADPERILLESVNGKHWCHKPQTD
jgi:hypothetical protein